MIGEFKLVNFRNCERARFVFSQPDNVFIGPNGAGKSNLLEALGFLGILRSFRTARPAEMIKLNEESFHLRGVWQPPSGRAIQLETALYSNGLRKLAIDQTEQISGRDFIQHFQPLFFAPEDIELISGAPGVRRRFFDMLGSQLDSTYMNVLHDYTRTLRQRNALLKSRRKIDPVQLEIYEGLLAFAGADLSNRRRKYVEIFNARLAELEPDPECRIRVEYRAQCTGGAEAYLELFARNRRREMERRSSLIGCHLDDFRVWRGNWPMRGLASNGQNRLAALYFKLAAAQMLMRDRGPEQLVILVDDVTGDLDRERRNAFYRIIEPAAQKFFTFTQLPDDEYFKNAQIWQLPLKSD